MYLLSSTFSVIRIAVETLDLKTRNIENSALEALTFFCYKVETEKPAFLNSALWLGCCLNRFNVRYRQIFKHTKNVLEKNIRVH
jgi:hypothetical protein